MKSVYTVIQDRYRLMDSAHLYRNEVEAVAVRRVIVKCLIKRENCENTYKKEQLLIERPQGIILAAFL